MNWASTDSPWGKTVTENLFGLHVKAIKTVVFHFVNFCLAIVGLTAFFCIQARLYSGASQKNHDSSSTR